VLPGVFNPVHVPICVIIQIRDVPLEIGVAFQELLRSRIGSGVKDPLWARVGFAVVYSSDMQWSVSERASDISVCACLGVTFLEVRTTNNWRRRRGIDFRHPYTGCTAVETVSLGDNCAVRTVGLIFVANVPHRSLVAHVLARPQQRVTLDRTRSRRARLGREICLLIRLKRPK